MQLCFRHPGEKDTGGEKEAAGKKKPCQHNQTKSNKSEAKHTLQSPGGTGVIAKKDELPCSSQPLLKALRAGSR